MILTGLLLYFFFIDRSIVNFRWFFIFLSENNEGVLTEMNMIMSNWKCELYNYVKIWVITLANWIMYYQKIKFCMKLNLIYNSTKSKLTLTALGCWLAHQTAPLHDFFPFLSSLRKSDLPMQSHMSLYKQRSTWKVIFFFFISCTKPIIAKCILHLGL